MDWVYNDGGRSAAGYRGDASDCGVRAASIASGIPYQNVYDNLNVFCQKERRSKNRSSKSSSRTGVYRTTYDRYLKSIGFEWVSTMGIGTGCQVHMKASELPAGNIIVRLSKHYAAVIDGVLHDTYDCTREETRCVYGYWIKPSLV